jgi:hypothetical protein
MTLLPQTVAASSMSQAEVVGYLHYDFYIRLLRCLEGVYSKVRGIIESRSVCPGPSMVGLPISPSIHLLLADLQPDNHVLTEPNTEWANPDVVLITRFHGSAVGNL